MSIRAVSDTSGTIVKEITYDTYGNILSDTNEAFKVPFGFAGGLYDTDTKLVRFGYRDYDSYTGKWTAKDPIDFSGGDTNLYGYVLGDPVGFVDVDGRHPAVIFLLIIAGGLAVGIVDERINGGGLETIAYDAASCYLAAGIAAVGGPLWLAIVAELTGLELSAINGANAAAGGSGWKK